MKTLLYIDLLFTLLILIYIVRRENRLHISLSKNSYFNKLIGINVMWNRKPLRKGLNASSLFYIPIRNYEKMEVAEDIHKYKDKNHQAKLQFLTATFSWLKTKEEVDKFEKDYKVIDENIVNNLVRNFNISLT